MPLSVIPTFTICWYIPIIGSARQRSETYLCPGYPSEYLLLRQEPRASSTARLAKFWNKSLKNRPIKKGCHSAANLRVHFIFTGFYWKLFLSNATEWKKMPSLPHRNETASQTVHQTARTMMCYQQLDRWMTKQSRQCSCPFQFWRIRAVLNRGFSYTAFL